MSYRENWLFSVFDKKPQPFDDFCEDTVHNFYLPQQNIGFSNISHRPAAGTDSKVLRNSEGR